VVTGEGVAFALPRAGIGSRTVASVVDLAIQFVALLILLVIDGGFGGVDSAAMSAVVIVEIVLVLAGYPIVSEWLGRGRTVGKLWLGLRVVRDDGGPIGFRQALVRGLSSLVLEKPGLVVPLLGAAIGMITAACSEREKRVGDMLAGTFVLNERAGTSRRPIAQDYLVPYSLQGWAAVLDLSRLDDRLALSVRQFLDRAAGMTPAAQHGLGEELRAAVVALISPPPPPATPTPAVLRAVLAERRRRALVPTTAGIGTPPPPTSPAQRPLPPANADAEASRPGRPASGGSPFTPPS
jgi:uncharacterized RDD family membrane protein YckC